MEDDEGEEESRVSVGSSSDNTVLIKIDGPDRFIISIGTFIIMYSIFRGGIALMFITEAGEILTALLALVIAAAFMAGGVLTVLNYRNGLIITLGTLGLSGLLSLLFSGGFNPLSIALWGTASIGHIISLMCSAVCMVFVGIPLLTSVNTLKPGWPGESETSSSPGSSNISSKERKITVACPYCDKNLRVPSDYSGKVRCTHCDELMEV